MHAATQLRLPEVELLVLLLVLLLELVLVFVFVLVFELELVAVLLLLLVLFVGVVPPSPPLVGGSCSPGSDSLLSSGPVHSGSAGIRRPLSGSTMPL